MEGLNGNVIVKMEETNNEILLFYVDDDGENEQRVLTNVQDLKELNGDDTAANEDEEIVYLPFENENSVEQTEDTKNVDDLWSEEESKRVLIFYIDNKQSFTSGSTDREYLWAVACKTMLVGRDVQSCEERLQALKHKYAQVRVDQMNDKNVMWSLYDLCHEAFQDQVQINLVMEDEEEETQPESSIENKSETIEQENKEKVKPLSPDKMMECMLKLYLNHRKFKYGMINAKSSAQKSIWDTIAAELGVEDGDYWHKRFLNYKQHYIRMLEKRKESGQQNVDWAYIDLFDEIFESDMDFQKKYGPKQETRKALLENVSNQNTNADDWNNTEVTVLVKYYFDSYDEFQDSTIPKNFLWTEVGRLLDKLPELCKQKYRELRNAHLDKYISGDYNLRNRSPMAILFDNIISKDTAKEMFQNMKIVDFSTEESDNLVKVFYENIEMLKDPVCYYVCFASVAKQLKTNIQSCKVQWDSLKELYKSVLRSRKENTDLLVKWRYIDLFDRIFDYGMDENLLDGYENSAEKNKEKASVKKGEEQEVSKNILKEEEKAKETISKPDYEMPVRRLRGKRKLEEKNVKEERKVAVKKDVSKDVKKDEQKKTEKYTEVSRHLGGDPKAFEILNYYLKNQDKFAKQKKSLVWKILGKKIGFTAEKCAHRFRNLKQVYKGYVQREVDKPDMPITWPYYQLCKKVFGYRQIKSKCKSKKQNAQFRDNWTQSETDTLIQYLAQNFQEISKNTNPSVWSQLAVEIGKTDMACNDKFLEMRKCYKKLKTMRSKKPDANVMWKYYDIFDEIFTSKGNCSPKILKVESMDTTEDLDNGDYCIIVVPEGDELTDLSNARVITKHDEVIENSVELIDREINYNENHYTKNGVNDSIRKWTKRSKRNLIVHYLNYLTKHKCQKINIEDMWMDISFRIKNQTPQSCRRKFTELRKNHIKMLKSESKTGPYFDLMQKVMKRKVKLDKTTNGKSIEDIEDMFIPPEKVQQALECYLYHLEEFMDPKIDKKYLWNKIAQTISVVPSHVYSKVHYLKNNYYKNINEIEGENADFRDILRQIMEKEEQLGSVFEVEQQEIKYESNGQPWSDDETKILLNWYLLNLDKFKNPKLLSSHLWKESSQYLHRSPSECSQRITEIRTEYNNKVKGNDNVQLHKWKFSTLCQKIFGTI